VPSAYIPYMRTFALSFVILAATGPSTLAQQAKPPVFSHADTLRGGNGPGRDWWDASFYDLRVAVHPADSSIRGSNASRIAFSSQRK